MKKIIAVLLTLAILGTNAFAFSSQTLSQLGIAVSGDDSHLVLRREFVSNILTLLDMSPVNDAEQVFSDVPKDKPYFGDIMAAYEAGIIHGEPGLTFRPDDPVTYEEAIRVFVDILGYDSYLKTGMNYASIANMIKLTSGISYSSKSYVNEANMSKLILNAIDIPTLEINYESGSLKYNMDGETLLQKHYDISKGRGIVKSVGDFALDTNAVTGEGFVRIEDELFAANGKDFSEYLGMKVDYLYSDEDGDLTVVAMELSSQSSSLDFKLYDIDSYSNRNVYYTTDSGSKRHLKLSDDVVIIYNGAPVESFSEDLFTGDNGSIKFISNDSSAYDVVIITEYEDYFVDSVDIKSSIIYDRYNKNEDRTPRKLDLSKVEEEDITSVKGKVVSINDINKYDIVSVMKKDNGEIVKVVVSQNSEEGKINSFDSTENIVVAEGKEYRVSENLLLNETITAGQSCKFYFNVNGLVAGIYIESSGSGNFGYVRNVWYEPSIDACQIKMLTTDNQIKVFDVLRKFTLDGNRDAHTEDTLKAALSDSIGVLPQVISYALDSEGKISVIDTVNQGNGENSDISLANIYAKTSNTRYIVGSAGFSNRLPVTGQTIIFKVPDETTAATRGAYSDDKYKVISLSTFKTDTRHDVAGYALGRASYLPDVIVKYSVTETVDTTTAISIISAISEGINQNDEIVKHIEYFREGVKTKGVVESPSVLEDITLAVGDVVRMTFSEDGEISYVERLYSISDGYDDTTAFQNGVANSAIDTHAASMFTKAYVYDKENSLLFVARHADIEEKADDGLTLNDMAAYDTSSAAVVIYDDDEPVKVRDGGLWDIKTTSSSIDIGDMVIMHVKYSKLMTVYVIK